MKRMFCFLLVIFLIGTAAFTSCSKKDPGKLICGVTEFEPMNYRVNGEWTGFDTEFALLVGEKLGLQVEFYLIDWAQKFSELNSGNIDAIWNGFTANTEEANGTPRINLCDMSYSYMINTQCVVVKNERMQEFTSISSLGGKTFAVEAGSAGETMAKSVAGQDGTIIVTPAKINTLMEVKSGAVDGAIIDIILAKEITGAGDYTALTIAAVNLKSEVYAIGFKKGNDLRDKVNQAIIELHEEGMLKEIAQKYKLENSLFIDKNFGKVF